MNGKSLGIVGPKNGPVAGDVIAGAAGAAPGWGCAPGCGCTPGAGAAGAGATCWPTTGTWLSAPPTGATAGAMSFVTGPAEGTSGSAVSLHAGATGPIDLRNAGVAS